MSSFEPPPYDSPVFNSGLFNTLDEVVTIDYADKNYFKLSGCLVKGFSTFNAGLSVNGGLALDGSNVDLSSISGITAGTAQANKALILNGSKNISNINQLNSTGSSSVIFSNNTAINSTYHQWINNSMSPNIVCRVQLNNDSATMGVSSSHPLKIMTAGLTRQFITSTGLIGINNTNPLYQLDIDGSLNTTNSMYMNGTEIIDASRNIKNIVNLTATTLSGTLVTPAQPNITSVGTLTSLVVSGNITGANIRTAGLVTATGNIQGGNILTAGFVSATGNYHVITHDHMIKMKNQAIVCNIGHFDNEIDMAGLYALPNVKRNTIKPQVDEFTFPDGHSIIILSEGRLLNLGNATGHPSFVMSNSFTNQVLAQIEIFVRTEQYPIGVYTLPKHLDEKVARLHLGALGVELTELNKKQAEYLGVHIEGPYKPDHYRY